MRAKRVSAVPTFASLTALRYLNLRTNSLSGTLPSFAALTLARLNLDNNHFDVGPDCPDGSTAAYDALGVGTVAQCDARCTSGQGDPIPAFTSGRQDAQRVADSDDWPDGSAWDDGTELCFAD